jgi:hemerythrin-like domain-containing protein
MSKTAQFRRQHGEIVEIVGQIEACLAPGKLPAAAAAVRSALSTLAGKLSIHLSMEDQSLYPRLKAHADKELRETAAKFDTEMSSIKAAFLAYNRKWSEQAIKNDPAGFAGETKQIFAALASRIQRENNVLYPLADKAA